MSLSGAAATTNLSVQVKPNTKPSDGAKPVEKGESTSKPPDSDPPTVEETNPVDPTTSVETTQPDEENAPKAGKKCPHLHHIGILYVLISVNISGIGSVLMKKYSEISFLTMMFYAFPIGSILSLCSIFYATKYKKRPIFDAILPLKQHKLILFLLWVRYWYLLISKLLTLYSPNIFKTFKLIVYFSLNYSWEEAP